MEDGQITGADLHLEAPVSQWRGRADAASKASAWFPCSPSSIAIYLFESSMHGMHMLPAQIRKL